MNMENKSSEMGKRSGPPTQLIDEYGFRTACKLVGYEPTREEVRKYRDREEEESDEPLDY